MNIEEKVCKICGSKEVVKRGKRTYSFCQFHFEEHFKNVKLKQKENLLEKYGVTNPMQIPEVREKHKTNLKEKYGVENISQVKEVKEKANNTFKQNYKDDKLEELVNRRKDTYLKNTETHSFNDPAVLHKRKATCLEKYGVDNVAKVPSIQEKKNNTFKVKYGGHPFSLPHVKEKVICNNINKYGTNFIFENEDFKERKKAVLLAKYGVEHPMQSPSIKLKAKNNYFEKTGYFSPLQNPKVRLKQRYQKRKNSWGTFLKQLAYKQIEPLFSLQEFLEFNKFYSFRCLRCNNTFETSGTNSQHIFCNCQIKKSNAENEIKEFLLSLGIENIIENYRPKLDGRHLELDLFLPEYTLGIEFHGLYWHSSTFVGNSYHKEKLEHFSKHNISVIQIFENEWMFKKEIVKSILRNRLGCSYKLYARKCSLKLLTQEEASFFYEINHIQGSINASIHVGLVFDEEIVSLMSFSNSRFDKNYTYELLRFANKLDTTIVGGFSKLLFYFKNNYMKNEETLLTYCDLRYFTGNGYLVNGFTYLSTTTPNYFYFKRSSLILESRLKFQKHLLPNVLPIFDINKTEFENMEINNYYRIYDAGNLKLFLKKIC